MKFKVNVDPMVQKHSDVASPPPFSCSDIQTIYLPLVQKLRAAILIFITFNINKPALRELFTKQAEKYTD